MTHLSLEAATLLIARARAARDSGLLSETDCRQFVTMVEYGCQNQKLATRRNGNLSNGKWIQRRRTGEVKVSATLRHLLEDFPFWEWVRAVGTYPDEMKWDAQYGRWQMLEEKHGFAPTWDIDREAYDWGREQQMRGRAGVGPRRAALLDDLAYFEWDSTDGRTYPLRAAYVAPAAARPGGTRWRPAEMTTPRGARRTTTTACSTLSTTPSPTTAPVVPSEHGFAADPHQWCRTNIADLMLREENYTLAHIAGFAGVSTVAVHVWIKDATGMGLKDWRTTNGWPSPTLSPARAAQIVALRSEFPGEPVKAFAKRLGISQRVAQLALTTTSV